MEMLTLFLHSFNNRYFLCSFHRGAEGFIAQARDWETRAEYNRAIDLYIRVTAEIAGNKSTVEDAYTKALELAIKFSKDRALSVAHEVCKRLMEIESYETVGDMLIIFLILSFCF